jgi:hypothetical protein
VFDTGLYLKTPKGLKIVYRLSVQNGNKQQEVAVMIVFAAAVCAS